MSIWYATMWDDRSPAPLRDPDPRVVQRVVEWLQHVRARPRMYIDTMDGEMLSLMLLNYAHAFRIQGLDIRPGRDVGAERGWNTENTCGIVHQMRRKGLSEAEVIDEVLAVEIGYWQALLDRLGGVPIDDDPAEPAPTERMRALLDKMGRPRLGRTCERATLTALIAALRHVCTRAGGTAPNLRALGRRARELLADTERSIWLYRTYRVLEAVAIALHDSPAPSPRAAEVFGMTPAHLLSRARALQAELAAEEVGR